MKARSTIDPAQALYNRVYNRTRNLPIQLERARARVRQLENEARSYGMHQLVGGGD